MSQQFVIMQKTCKNEHCKRKFDKTSPSDLCQACSAAFKSGESQTQGKNDLYVKKIRDLEVENLSIKLDLNLSKIGLQNSLKVKALMHSAKENARFARKLFRKIVNLKFTW